MLRTSGWWEYQVRCWAPFGWGHTLSRRLGACESPEWEIAPTHTRAVATSASNTPERTGSRKSTNNYRFNSLFFIIRPWSTHARDTRNETAFVWGRSVPHEIYASNPGTHIFSGKGVIWSSDNSVLYSLDWNRKNGRRSSQKKIRKGPKTSESKPMALLLNKFFLWAKSFGEESGENYNNRFNTWGDKEKATIE